MKTVVLDVRPYSETIEEVKRAVRARRPSSEARISFTTPELLWRVLTTKRWELLKSMTGAGPMSIREASRRVDRDVKAVHGDITALLNTGILRRTPEGLVEFPYDAVKIEFMLRAA